MAARLGEASVRTRAASPRPARSPARRRTSRRYTGISLSDLDNDIGALGNLTNTTSGQIGFSSNDGFDLTGAITAGGSQFVSLIAISGEINQQAGGTITRPGPSSSARLARRDAGAATTTSTTLGVVVAGSPRSSSTASIGFDISAVLDA